MLWKRTLLLSAAALFTHAAMARTPTKPYTVEVWSNVLFDTHGRVEQFRIIDESSQPKAFVEQVSARLDKAVIEPRIVDGQPVSFRTGVQMSFRVTPSDKGASVKMQGMRVSPLPLKRAFASYPDDLAKVAGWDGTVDATCYIGLDGRCEDVEVEALAGIPESARRWAVATFKLWSFEPQQLDNKPQRGLYRMVTHLETDGPVRDDFRQDKFERVIQQR